MNKLEYLKRAKQKQLEKYFSQESIEKRKEKRIQYLKNQKLKQTKLKRNSSKKDLIHLKDIEFYKEIWTKRPHYCENCGDFLGKDFKDFRGNPIVYRYAHIISKSIYPYLRHYDKNILLLCLNCHSKLDTSPKEIIEKMKCYNKDYIEELKELHKSLEKENNTLYI